MSSLNVKRVPNAADVPRGAIINVTTPEERRRSTMGAVLIVLGTATIGGLVGYAVGIRRGKKRNNPKRRRR